MQLVIKGLDCPELCTTLSNLNENPNLASTIESIEIVLVQEDEYDIEQPSKETAEMYAANIEKSEITFYSRVTELVGSNPYGP